MWTANEVSGNDIPNYDSEFGVEKPENYEEMIGESMREIWEREKKQRQLGEYAQRYKDKANISNEINLEEDGILLTPKSFLMFQATVKDLMLQHDNFYEQENIEDVLMEFAAEEGLLDDGKLDADDISEMRYYTISEEYREKLGSYFEETQSDINYSKVQQGINEILDTGKISEEQIKNNPDLLAFLEHKLGFNDFKKKVNEPSDHLSGGRQFIEFLKRGNMLEEGEHEEYDGNKEYSIKKECP